MEQAVLTGRGMPPVVGTTRLRWLLLLLLNAAGYAAGAIPASCAGGCVHQVAVVCGSDGHDYQSACLAVCQGVSVVHRGPCEEVHGWRRRRSIQLHRVLQEVPDLSKRRRRLMQQPPTDWGGPAGGDEAPPVLSRADMHAFRHEGFTLVGLVELQNVHAGEQASQPQGSSSASGSSSSSAEEGSDVKPDHMDTVRALRITPAGLLYAATLDLAELSASIRNSSRSTAAGVHSMRSAVGAAQVSGRGAQQSAVRAMGLSSARPGLLVDEGDNSQFIVEEDDGLPHLPYYNPWEHPERQVAAREARLRRLAAITEEEAIAAKNTVYSPGAADAAAGATGSDASSLADLGSNLDLCPSAQFPFTAIGQLLLTDSAGDHVCSGALVGRDAVLTAGHCVFKRNSDGGGVFYNTLDFAAGRWRAGTRTVNPYGVTPWACATIFDTYQSVPEQYQFTWDVCVLRLAEPVGDDAGWLGMASGCAYNVNTGQPQSSYKVTMAGYPASLPLGTCTVSNCRMLRDDCKARTALHTCPSLAGQSGAPFYLPKDNKVRGVLVGTMKDSSGEQAKVANIVGTASYSAILNWVKESIAQAVRNDRTSDDTTKRASSTTSRSTTPVPSPKPSPNPSPESSPASTTPAGSPSPSPEISPAVSPSPPSNATTIPMDGTLNSTQPENSTVVVGPGHNNTESSCTDGSCSVVFTNGTETQVPDNSTQTTDAGTAVSPAPSPHRSPCPSPRRSPCPSPQPSPSPSPDDDDTAFLEETVAEEETPRAGSSPSPCPSPPLDSQVQEASTNTTAEEEVSHSSAASSGGSGNERKRSLVAAATRMAKKGSSSSSGTVRRDAVPYINRRVYAKSDAKGTAKGGVTKKKCRKGSRKVQV